LRIWVKQSKRRQRSLHPSAPGRELSRNLGDDD
jgi:hypothetical protein